MQIGKTAVILNATLHAIAQQQAEEKRIRTALDEREKLRQAKAREAKKARTPTVTGSEKYMAKPKYDARGDFVNPTRRRKKAIMKELGITSEKQWKRYERDGTLPGGKRNGR